MNPANPFVVEVAMEMALPRPFLESIAKRFGPEKARECAMSTSVGGIGPLLKERVIEQAEIGIDVIGVSLLYESVWAQTWHEWGQLNLQKHKVGKELRQMMTKTDLGFKLKLFDDTEVDVEVWSLMYGRAPVYFLAVPSVNDVVYPGPKDMPPGTPNPYAWSHECRMKQSWIVGRGALQLCKKLNKKPDIITLSETPTIFAQNKIVKDEFQKDDFFSDTRYIFNDHTPLEYAHPIWDSHTLLMVKLDPSVYIDSPAWNPQRETLDVTSLLVNACDSVYGVARKHGDVMKAMPSLRQFAGKIQYVTNGVRVEEWQAPEFTSPEKKSDEDLVSAKSKYRKKLLDWVWRHCRLWPEWAAAAGSRKIVVWTRRITPYKRLDTLVKMLKSKEWRERFMRLNIVVLFGGRIHQQDNHAQDIVYDLLDLLDKDRGLQERVVFIDNFNVWEAPYLFQGADGAIMLADDTREASATGFMKAQMNGAAILATADGAVPEFVFFQNNGASEETANGFNIPYVNGEPTPEGLLLAFEAFDRAYQNPAASAKIMRAALAVTGDVSVNRTAREMKDLYERTLAQPAAPQKA